MSIHDHYRREQDRKARQANDRRHRHAFGMDVGGESWASSPIDQDTPGGGAARAETYDPAGAAGLGGQTRQAHMSFVAAAQTVSGAVVWTPVVGGLTRPRLFETAIVMPLTGPASISGELGWDGWTGCTSVTVAQVRGGTDVDTLTLSVPSWDAVRSTVVVIPHTGLEFELEAGDTVQVRVAGGEALAGGVLTVTQLEQPPLVVSEPQLWAVGYTTFPAQQLVSTSIDGVSGTPTSLGSEADNGGADWDGTHILTVDTNDYLLLRYLPDGTLDASESLAGAGGGFLLGGGIDITLGGGSLWFCSGASDKVTRHNPSTFAIEDEWLFSVDEGPFALTWDGTHLWIGSVGSGVGRLSRVDVDGVTVSSFTTGSILPYGMAFDGVDLWVGVSNSGTLYRISTAGAVLDTVVPDWSLTRVDGLAWVAP